MAKNTLEEAMAAVSAIWGPLTTELVEASRLHIESLAKASPEESWLAALHRDQPSSADRCQQGADIEDQRQVDVERRHVVIVNENTDVGVLRLSDLVCG